MTEQAEEGIRPEEKDPYRTLAQNLPGIVYRVFIRENNRMQFFNNMLKPLTGFVAEELEAGEVCRIDPLILPEDRPRVVEAIRQAVNGHHPFEVEYRLKTKWGEIRYVTERGTPIYAEDGKPLYIDGIIIDITKCRKLEEELRQYRQHLERLVQERTEQLKRQIREKEQAEEEITFSRRRLRYLLEETRSAYAQLNQILNSVVDGMCVTDKESNILKVSDTFCRLFGISRSQAEGKKCCQVICCPFCHDPSQCPIGLIRSGKIEQYEGSVEIESRSGQKLFFELTAKSLRRPDGELIGVIENFRDITERKRADELLRESEEKYSTLIEQAKDVVGIIDGEIITFANKAASKLTGYSVEELVGSAFFRFLAPEVREGVRHLYRLLLAGEKIPSTFDTKIVSKEGVIKDVEVSASLIHYQGKPVVMFILHDITEQKRRENEIERLQKIESLGVLAAGLAHDFNNLLTAITGNASLLQEYSRSARYPLAGIVDEIQKAARQAKGLTQQLLTLSKGGGEPVKKPLYLAPLIKEAAIFASSGSRARCEFTLPDDLWPAEVDARQISQVINNLVINASQAMPNGGIIDIQAQNIVVRPEDKHLPLEPGRYVKISVKDNGVGISPKDLPKIFDPYFTTKKKGSGLGLAITYSIIKKHNGHITVESRLGVGTSFHIYLPAVEREISAKEVWTVRETKAAAGGRILFMDDQKMVRDMVGRMLTNLGYEVVLAKEGDEAIELYKRAKERGCAFAAVILDLTIPGGMGGEEVVRRLHEIDPGVKAIVSSGYADDPIMSDYREHGFQGVVAKPYEIEELSKILSQVIQEGEKVNLG